MGFSYLADVLGIESFIRPQGSLKPVVFVAENTSPVQQELLAKMIKAMGLRPEETRVVSSALETEVFAQARGLVALGDFEIPAAALEIPSLKIHGLSEMIAQPGLKREVWKKLQEFMGMI